ncbi:uncharacterized protein PAC_05492 [Phialocephala subalpina]|uniref:DUF4185 domain-containing protein n=1 Tax=Phialocephala subalpina TaxID=576137 RepID=A0A1L7WS55_9HELO|nr:uncharacterized protein PAC_05492 [Phialocephala subalpina]
MSPHNMLKAFAAASLPIVATAVTVQSAVLLGNVTSSTTEDIRDLGFSGVVGDVALNSYGDTLICGDGLVEDRYYQTPRCVLLHANSAAYSEPGPTTLEDFNLDANENAQIFGGYSTKELAIAPESSYGMEVTNVIAGPGLTTQGIPYFLKNYRPDGHDHIVGGGVAVVDVTGPYPTCNHWWDCTKEPQYGDYSQVLADDGYIYVYAGTNKTIFYDGVYLTRVPHDQQQDFTEYEYWDGTQFTTGAEVRGKTAPKPEGPWGPMTEYVSLFNATEFAFCYSPSQQTRYDSSGKTLVISYTGYPNIIQAIKVVSHALFHRSERFRTDHSL